MAKVGERLRELRDSKGLKQKDIYTMLGIVERQYGRYEKSEVDIPMSKLITLADFYNVSLDYLTGRTDKR